jgi:hypothetical protein
MSTADHKQTVAGHTASTVTINSALNYSNLSIAQAIEEAIADSSKPPSEQSLLGSGLPNDLFKNPGMSQLETLLGRFFNDPSSDPGTDGSHDPLSDLAGAITAARSRLTALDPTNQPDPTQKPDLVGNSLPSASELRNELASLLGIPASSLPADPKDPKNQESGSHHRERPDGPPTGDPAGAHDPNHAKVEGMLSAGGSGSDSMDYKDKHGHVHHWEDHWDGKGNEVISDKDQKTGAGTVTILHADHSSVKQTTDPAHHTVTTTTTSADRTQTTTTAITDKKVWPDGTVTVSETKQGEPPLEPLDPKGADSGGKNSGGGAKMPDGDHQTVLPDWLRNEVQKELQAEIKSMHLPTHDNDTVNVRDDVPGTVSQGDLKGITADKFHNILGGDTFNNEGIWQDGGAGSVSPNYNGTAGAIDYGPDHDEVPQTSGRKERNPQHPIHTDPTAHGNASEPNADAGGRPDLSLSGLIETAAQQAAHKLQDAMVHDDPWGTRARYEQAANSPANVAETPAQKAAHELQDAAAQHDAPNQHEPIKPHENLAGAGLGGIFDHGPDHGGGSQADAASGFADLMHAAQNPKEFVTAVTHPGGAETSLHVAGNADLGGHGAHFEDAHVASAAVPAADIHVDHYSVSAPMIDHVAIGHH